MSRDYKKEYREYQGKPEQIKRRAQRNAARAAVEKRVGDLPSNVDVDHSKPIRKGGTNATKNLRVASQTKNRGWRKGLKGYG